MRVARAVPLGAARPGGRGRESCSRKEEAEEGLVRNRAVPVPLQRDRCAAHAARSARARRPSRAVAPFSPGTGKRMRWPVTSACGSAVGFSARSVSIGTPVLTGDREEIVALPHDVDATFDEHGARAARFLARASRCCVCGPVIVTRLKTSRRRVASPGQRRDHDDQEERSRRRRARPGRAPATSFGEMRPCPRAMITVPLPASDQEREDETSHADSRSAFAASRAACADRPRPRPDDRTRSRDQRRRAPGRERRAEHSPDPLRADAGQQEHRAGHRVAQTASSSGSVAATTAPTSASPQSPTPPAPSASTRRADARAGEAHRRGPSWISAAPWFEVRTSTKEPPPRTRAASTNGSSAVAPRSRFAVTASAPRPRTAPHASVSNRAAPAPRPPPCAGRRRACRRRSRTALPAWPAAPRRRAPPSPAPVARSTASWSLTPRRRRRGLSRARQ